MTELKHEQARYYLHIGSEHLSGPERDSLGRHLSECGDCKRYATELGTLQSALSQVMHARWDTLVPNSVTDKKIQTRIRRKIAQKRTLSLANSLAAGAALLGVIFLIAWFFQVSEPLPITPGSAIVPTRVNQTFGNTITLLGFGLSGDQIAAGDALTTTLYWQARVTPRSSYMVFVHVQDADGKLVLQSDSLPADGARPATSWKPDEVIEDRRLLRLPGSLAPGRYSLIIGVYDPSTGARLNTGEGKDALMLATVTVRSSLAKTYPVILTGKAIDLNTLQVSQSQGQAQIEFKLNEEGTRIFSDYTAMHIGQYVGIALDKKVLTSPKILQPIRTGAGVIQGQFSLEQAQQIAEEIKKNPEWLEFVDAADAPLPLGASIQTGATPSAALTAAATPGAGTFTPDLGTSSAVAQTPELAAQQDVARISRGGANSFQVIGKRSWQRGVILLFTYSTPAQGSEPAFQVWGYSVVEQEANGTWRATRTSSAGSSGPVSGSNLVEALSGTDAPDFMFALVAGRTVSPKVASVEASFDNGQILRDQTGDGIFALLAPTVAVCELRVLDISGNVLLRIDLAPRDWPGHPPVNCPTAGTR